MTAHVMLSCNDFLTLNILSFIPVYLSLRSISLRSTLLKAFSKSINVTNVLFCELRVLINDEIVKICSSQDRLGLNLFCFSTIDLLVSRWCGHLWYKKSIYEHIFYFLLSPNFHDDAIKWRHFPRYWPFVRETTGHQCIPLTKASHTDLLNFLWSAPQQTVDLRRHPTHCDVR